MVNLYLHVVGRRPDGYHLLDSLVVFAGAADRLEAEPHSDLVLELLGPAAAALARDDGENLVLRAARLLAKAGGTLAGARLRLCKTLPVASGIGGGSADAAATLRLLSRLWRLTLPPEALAALALQLGADVPVCLAGTPARMSGIGEVLAPAPALPTFGLLLVNPGVAVATPDVFRARQGPFSPPADLGPGWCDAAGLAATLEGQRNDLEASAVALCPAIADARAAIARASGCLLARMSGSGATCFGLFATAAAAEAAAQALERPAHWWVWGGAGHTDELAAAPPPD